jgi:hypothetical protein
VHGIASWKDFFAAVERMRACQKEYCRTRSPAALNASKKCEAAVDSCIKKKRAEWALEKQPELEVAHG